MYGTSEKGWVVVPPNREHVDYFGPFSREEALAFMRRRGFDGDYAVNLRDHPNWFNV
jgi:hypothetical protein